jgi:hypothetical protein
VVESVRAYLHTFRLNERELAPGLTIPYAVFVGFFGNPPTGLIGTARATGRIGPAGHQIYEVNLAGNSEQHFVEIAPQ